MDVTATAPSASLPTATAPAVPARRSPFMAAALGWVVPGFGQLYMGRPFKALLMMTAIGGLFFLGLALTGFTCVNPETYSLEFVAHAFLGGPTAAAYYLTQGIELNDALPWFEVGRLYAAVAGLLNAVAICDALGDVIEHNRRVRIQASLRQRWLVEREAERQRAVEKAALREAEMRRRAQGEVTLASPDGEEPTAAPAQPAEPAVDLPAFFDDDEDDDEDDDGGYPA